MIFFVFVSYENKNAIFAESFSYEKQKVCFSEKFYLYETANTRKIRLF